MRRKDEMENLVTRKTPPKGSARNGKGASPSQTTKALITRNLRMAYGEVASEPLPEEWVRLLNQIDGDEGKKS